MVVAPAGQGEVVWDGGLVVLDGREERVGADFADGGSAGACHGGCGVKDLKGMGNLVEPSGSTKMKV